MCVNSGSYELSTIVTIVISNFSSISLIVFVLWSFKKITKSDCDLNCDYSVSVIWCL